MIKNVIFDLGRVVYRYWPREDIINLGYSEAQADQIMDCVFDSPTWQEIDRDQYTMQEGKEKFCADFPHLEADIRRIMDDGWADRVETIMPESLDFFHDVKRQGYKTYILSNFAADGFDYIRTRDAHFFDQVDGMVVSGHVKLIKPDPEIYKLLLNRYNLVPQETLFIDDNQDNITAAKALGIHGILFTDIADCKQQFKQLTTSRTA